MNKDTYLITGGCGFIGSHVIDELLKDESVKKIINIDRLSTGSDINNVAADSRVINYYLDICDEELFNIFKKHLPGYIIHLAAESHVDRSISDPLSFVNSNVIGTGNILECIRNIVPDAKMVHVSTDEVYGHLNFDDEPFTEDTPLDPRSPYSASKAGSDVLTLSYRTTYGMNVVVTRCCNNYGPRQHGEKLIPTVLRTLINGKKVPVYGNGKNIREWIYVTDHAKALIEILHKTESKPVYNIYGRQREQNIKLINEIIVELVNIDSKYSKGYEIEDYVEYVTDRPGHDLCYKMSSKYDEIKALKDQEKFNSGLLKTILYYKSKYEKKDPTTI
jgi:dTDP-glucose 4,6-dehydratase